MADYDMNQQTNDEKEKDYGVLLYYKYAGIPDVQKLFDFYHSNCTSLSLLGRVRLSSQGVNVTVGGRLMSLEKHIEVLKSNALFQGTDFKLASCSEPLSDQVAKECGFTSLSIRIVKELVTLTSHPLLKSPEISNAGRHLSAAEFHSVIQNAGKCQELSTGSDKELILLDARNLYETRIGKFHAPDVKTLDPAIRQYSDLPSWIDNNSEQLRGNNILMYCTGGIRCEMASAYIRSKGAGFENVFQLYGGIQRYMEQFPDGGFFKGKNFVFDHRVSVGSLDPNMLGTCLLCGASFDDYTSRCRCTHCRMLVLICNHCQDINSSYVCELCQKDGKPVPSVSSMSGEVMETAYDNHQSLKIDRVIESPLSSPSEGQNTAATMSIRKLRILCLHGFRQNASGFKGRTASLAKKLKNIADIVFVNAPHELPFIYQAPPADENHSCEPAFEQKCPPLNHCNKKFAWLVDADYDGKNGAEWKMAKAPFDSLQYQQQTEGFEKSIEYLKTVFSQMGPFDGILGFSQGAAMAALVSAHREKLKGDIDFRFVILCSGFSVNMPNHGKGSINCPSLHIFGYKEGEDRQIGCEASRQLASLFENECSVIIEHDSGHIIPTRSPYIGEIKDFLRRFQ
ncbi:rhodanese-like domain protein [Perilla frutescens var. hirtella]|uniref:Rhodanese-like domain protein n=1 Tax=Perilla frutescens var. hirtella TaxID=608512 RepID=A0AAD4P598_PERFH|nr:rhodanese-like domain protein [Perilla frutescens var. hirtella]KAH6804804.1 rhodanese-like domain protein [Perilla frutescens var. frutescens]KAH6826450.1 rhodanese-like domain protein [Perilla frutescens var. hirtella]